MTRSPASIEGRRAQEVGLEAGQTNCSLFYRGDGTPDTYTYQGHGPETVKSQVPGSAGTTTATGGV